jgi:SNF2 family DNA or RNA helicase
VAYKYHGRSRESQNEIIQHIDIILTTYATAVSELRRRKGLLHKTDFYRLVLDEGTYS